MPVFELSEFIIAINVAEGRPNVTPWRVAIGVEWPGRTQARIAAKPEKECDSFARSPAVLLESEFNLADQGGNPAEISWV